jgi:hypothetical protein
MIYRALDENGDYKFGNGSADFLKNSPPTVAQHVATRLKLLQSEWFLDLTEGTPWKTRVLGTDTMSTYNMAIRERILNTEGVTGIAAYSSSLNRDTRELSVSATINTTYGVATVNQVL